MTLTELKAQAARVLAESLAQEGIVCSFDGALIPGGAIQRGLEARDRGWRRIGRNALSLRKLILMFTSPAMRHSASRRYSQHSGAGRGRWALLEQHGSEYQRRERPKTSYRQSDE